ncbi:MAG: DNA recombination protein RmuC [Firmicutes bacterium]|nr:DNA recombination protein RmuC [Bacillota bacterium]
MIEIVTLVLLVSLMIFLVVFLVIQNQKKAIPQDQSDLKVYMQKEYEGLKTQLRELIYESNEKNTKDLYKFKDLITVHIENKLKEMNTLVEKRLQGGFERTNETFVNVVERLSKIDEAQKNIEQLSKEVVSLNSVLADKKTRGIYGEVQLYQLLSAVFGQDENLYKTQVKLSNQTIADAVLYAPEPLGMVVIDSKFPLDNYKRMTNSEYHQTERDTAKKLFQSDVKKHIDDIANKYIIEGETSHQAILFLPAEAIFAEITAHHETLVEYSNNRRVWLTSPTTLFSTLTMIQVFVQNLKRDEQTKVIIDELNKLNIEFMRYSERWEKLNRSIDTIKKDAEKMSTTTEKIKKKFDYIKDAKFEEARFIDNMTKDEDNDGDDS